MYIYLCVNVCINEWMRIMVVHKFSSCCVLTVYIRCGRGWRWRTKERRECCGGGKWGEKMCLILIYFIHNNIREVCGHVLSVLYIYYLYICALYIGITYSTATNSLNVNETVISLMTLTNAYFSAFFFFFFYVFVVEIIL